MDESLVSIVLSRKKTASRGPFFVPTHLRQYIPEEYRVESGIHFGDDKKIKYLLPKPLAAYLMNKFIEKA